MNTLRCLIAVGAALICLVMTRVAAAADSADGLEPTRSLARVGAVQLGLHRIDTLQPADATLPRWAEWEQLRLQLLAAAGRHEELLRRVGVLPAGVTAKARAELHALAVPSALALGQGAAAREHAGRALWTSDISASRLRELRLQVIRSLVRESRGDDAYRSMLRFDQDYRPLDPATAAGFVDGLLDVGMAKEAVTWLGLLEERGPAKLRLRLHTGLVAPQEAAVLARAGFVRSEEPSWWRLLLDAAGRMQSGVLRIEALERLLQMKEVPAADVRMLWDAYLGYAREAANTHQLLAGDDQNWMEFAQRRRDADPVIARAYFAYLARHARGVPDRQQAQLQLAASYAASGLPRTAMRVYHEWPGDPAALSAAARYTLGTLAEGLADHDRALHYRQGLPAPEGSTDTDWKLRLAALALRAGKAGVALEITRQLAGGKSAIPAAQMPEWIVLAQQCTDHGLYDGAQTLFERALPHADATQGRVLLAGMARLHEMRDQPLLAADYYLRAALRASAPDAAAAEARLQAGLNLTRAGLRDDARAQFEWLLKNSRDPAQIAVARRELGF